MEFELIAKKKFGQNFLINPKMQDRVVLELERNLSENIKTIVEVGPGAGDLTKHLFKFEKPVVALDIDPESVELLKTKFSSEKNFKVILQDALMLLEEDNEDEIFTDESIFFSNLPFNVGSRMLVSLGVKKSKIPFVIILQKEVVEKTNVKNKLTFLGGWLNLIWDTKIVFQISKGNFSPSPKVMSALMTGVPKNLKWLENKQTRIVAKNVLKSLFAQPKKTLSNNLRNMDWSVEKVSKFYKEYSYPANIRITWDNYQGVLQNILQFEDKKAYI